ncbi:Hypothetical predicted protein [Pelobates cultripes]|uniref:Uncharacterized protein n=1 Tax=Pelobates cultripes TaxID=61616 RepID=A0AAD1TDN8_PELCU|nr:Hypothetical predicted protein [Pelobates cultripes]
MGAGLVHALPSRRPRPQTVKPKRASRVTHTKYWPSLQKVNDLEILAEDLANRSWHNKLRVRCLAENQNEGTLIAKMEHYFKNLLPDIPEDKWVIDRATGHCAPKELEAQVDQGSNTKVQQRARTQLPRCHYNVIPGPLTGYTTVTTKMETHGRPPTET